jgi:prepilin-type N-terminal cleavage/methylation domain-containing protein
MSIKTRTSSRRAFTLIETLVAVTILTLAVAGPMVTANRAIVAAQTAKDQLTASYLAQEGIEYVRAIRDGEYLVAHSSGDATTAWSTFINGIESVCLTSCTLDPMRPMGYGPTSALSAVSGTAAPLRIATTTFRYTQQNLAGSTLTPYTRTLQVVRNSAADERIISRVSWNFHGTTYSVTITGNLTSWQ